MRRYTQCKKLYKDLDIVLVLSTYISEIIQHMKLLHAEKLEQNTTIHSPNTPNLNLHLQFHNTPKLNLHIQFSTINAMEKAVMNKGIKLYNKLPNKIGK